MRQWRVGTISLGMTLLVLGTGLVYSMLNQIKAAELITKWWPLIFIVLGIELLAQFYTRKNGEIPMKYDFISILLILFIVVSGLALQVFSEFGLAGVIQEQMNSRSYTLPMAGQDIPVAEGVDRIVIKADRCNADIRTAAVKSCTITGTAVVEAPNRDAAIQVQEEQQSFSSRINGNMLQIDLSSPPVYNHMTATTYETGYSLVIPEGITVEIEGTSGSIRYTGSGPGSNLTIDGSSDVTVFLPPTTGAMVSSFSHNANKGPEGSLQWKTVPQNTVPATSDALVPDNNINRQQTQVSPSLTEFRTMLGDGSRSIKVFSTGSQAFYLQ